MPHAAQKMRGAPKEIQMKRFFGFAFMLVLFTAPAFAGNKAQKMTVPTAVQIGSTPIRAGVYDLTWTGSGSNAQVTLAQNKKTVVTFTASAVEGKSTPGIETYNHDGVAVLTTIHMDKVTFTLVGAPQPGQ
jgi:hypothetical protein